ncbi:MAG: VWA domain-containing protein [Candidatus Altiarchaeota archaeon]|nr:VWA domain-containing protein [Candidatus Altiarchaeota archaeon]
MKKGYATVLDAMLAIAFTAVVLASLAGLDMSNNKLSTMSSKRLHYMSEDALDTLNKRGVLDVVGEQWAAAAGNRSNPHFINATQLSTQYLDTILPGNVGYMLTIDGEMVANNTRAPVDTSGTLTHSTRLLVGYGRGLPTRGYVARAFLTNIKEKTSSSYSYFGGFVGQGNITVYARDIPYDSTIQRCCLELNTPSNFDLYINSEFAGSFTPTGGNMSANLKEGAVGGGNGCVESQYLELIDGGTENMFELKFTEGDVQDHYVGGGYVKVFYNTSEMDTNEAVKTMKYYFPGINGIINLYDSFYVPGTVNSMSLNLEFLSNYSTYLNIGDVTVYNSSGSETPQTVTLSGSEMAAKGFIYQPVDDPKSVSLKTVPLRMGTGTISQIVESGNADVVLITDVSGSMMWRIGYTDSTTGVERACSSASLYNSDTRRISLAKCLAKDFINTIMNHTGNRIALVSFDSIAEADGHSPYRLTDTQTNNSLIAKINSYSNTPSGGTCVCCAINKAYELLEDDGDPSKDYYIVVMTDGITGYTCGGCTRESGQNVFYTGFEDSGEISEWSPDPTRTTATNNINYGRASEGSYGGNPQGSHTGSYYFGIWGDFDPGYLALDRTPIDLTGYDQVNLSIWYSFEDTEDADEIGFYYLNDTGWVKVFEDLTPQVGNGAQKPWAKAQVTLPQNMVSLVLSYWGQTSSSTEHLMVDDLRISIPSGSEEGCLDCICSAYSTAGVVSACGGNPADCSNSACQPAIDDAICAAERAHRNLGAEIRTIGFSPSTVGCDNAEDTLQGTAECGGGAYCEGGDAEDAANCYINFSRDIYVSSTKSQTIYYGGAVDNTQLYPTSYIEFEFTPINETTYGEVSMMRSTDAFDDTVDCEGTLYVPDGVVVSQAKATSYSGPHWTDYLRITNEGGTNAPYQLTNWGTTYSILGDPYTVDIPAYYINSGEDNVVYIRTSDNSSQATGCSPDNRVIYTMRMRTLVGYGNVFPTSEGCIWTIEFEDGSTYSAPIPTGYSGSQQCTYEGAGVTYDEQDAVSDAIYRLLYQLDIDKDGRVDLLFDPDMIDFELSQAGGVKSLWGPAMFKLIVWI